MVKKILFLLIVISTISLLGRNKWRMVTEASYSPLQGVFFLNENLGWAVGSSGTILKTADGGETWEKITEVDSVTSTLYSVFFVNEKLGFAGGAKDIFLKTINGGKTWKKIAASSNSGDIRSIYFADENTGWILAGTRGGGEILYTTDGAATWTVQLTETTTNIKAMAFHSKNHGVCVGGKKGRFVFYYTTDGQNWTKAPNPTGVPSVYTRTDLYAVAMASDNVACATGWGSRAAGLQPSIILRTTDGGANWTYETQAEENRLYINMYGMAFKDELTGIAVGGSTYKGTVAYKTTDGGKNWSEISLPTGFSAKAISWINNKVCVVGSGGSIVISNDNGNNWKVVTPIINSTLNDIDILPNNRVVAGGFYGAFIYSDEYGNNWQSSYVAGNNVCPTVKDIFFLDENIGYAAQLYRVVSKTTDGGKTWTQIMKDTTESRVGNYGVQFINENIGFVVGKYGSDVSAFHKTTDGGKTWTSLIGDENLVDELNLLWFFDEKNGVVAGDGGALAYTMNGGKTWTKVVPNHIPSASVDYCTVDFLDNNLGLIAGKKTLIKTTDGGKTWEYIAVPDLPKDIKGVGIANETTWYLSGSKFLFYTADAGAHWANVLNLDVVTATSIYEVVIDSNGYPWISCGSSEVYTSAPELVGVEEVDNSIPEKFKLEANYPNPFNPSTVIKYSLPASVSGSVTLKVYNLLGQEVATLVNQSQKAGTYHVNFDASKLSSGIYIYTLKAAGFSQSKKMMLIK
jgi:photosystem II stability/assembly factor-like uncharacterized protein